MVVDHIHQALVEQQALRGGFIRCRLSANGFTLIVTIPIRGKHLPVYLVAHVEQQGWCAALERCGPVASGHCSIHRDPFAPNAPSCAQQKD